MLMSTRPVVLQDVFDIAKLVFWLVTADIPNEYEKKHSYDVCTKRFSEKFPVFLVN